MSKRGRKAIESSDEDYEPNKKRNTNKKLNDDYETTLSDSLSGLSVEDESEYNEGIDYKAILEYENEGESVKTVNILSKELERFTNSLENKKVTLTSILASRLHDSDKETAIELFGILNGMEQNTFEYYQLNNLLITMITGDEILSDVPTINKILKASICKEDKLKAIEVYNMFYNVGMSSGGLYSEEWYALKKRINLMVNKKRNVEELVILEEKEKEIKSFQPQKIDMKTTILNLEAPIEVKKKLYDMYMNMMSSSDESEKHALFGKLNWYTKLPHNKQLPLACDDITTFCMDIYNKLNESLYGMFEVKEKILLHINNKLKNPQSCSILALNGLAGVGKSKIVKCLAKVLNIPYNKLSFGGAIDSTLLLGGDAMWKNSSPSMLIKILCDSKCSNPIILLDEIDKLTDSSKGKEVQSALLHILDKTQNDQFNDSYLCEYSHNLSNIWFIATMNSDKNLDPALKDRLEIINVPSYTKEELIKIITNYTLPATCNDHSYNKTDITISENACNYLLNNIKNDIKTSGVRKIEEEIKNIVSKISFLDRVGYKEEFNLSFKLKQKITFPFVIDESTIKSLMQKKESTNDSYKHMYI